MKISRIFVLAFRGFEPDMMRIGAYSVIGGHEGNGYTRILTSGIHVDQIRARMNADGNGRTDADAACLIVYSISRDAHILMVSRPSKDRYEVQYQVRNQVPLLTAEEIVTVQPMMPDALVHPSEAQEGISIVNLRRIVLSLREIDLNIAVQYPALTRAEAIDKLAAWYDPQFTVTERVAWSESSQCYTIDYHYDESIKPKPPKLPERLLIEKLPRIEDRGMQRDDILADEIYDVEKQKRDTDL